MKICRLCLSEEKLNTTIDQNILQKITFSLAFSISMNVSDKLSKRICDSCIDKIEDICVFKNKVLMSENHLRTAASNKVRSSNSETDDTVLGKNCLENIKQELTDMNLNFQTKTFISIAIQTGDFSSPEVVANDFSYDLDIKKENVDFENHFYDESVNNVDNTNYSSEDDMTLNEIVRVPTLKSKIKNEHPASQPTTKKSKKRKKNKRSSSSLVLKLKNAELDIDMKCRDINIDMDDIGTRISEYQKCHQCLICFMKLSSKKDLTRHYKDHYSNPQKYLFPEYIKPKLESEEITTEDENISFKDQEKRLFYVVNLPEFSETQAYQCLKCQKLFISEASVLNHLINHDDSKIFPCNKCGRSYRKAYDIFLHGKAHSEEKEYVCKFVPCDYSTVYYSALLAHHKRHEPNYKYTCDICNKGFDIVTWFEEHKNFHTGHKPFVCDICGKSFMYSRYLTTHRTMVHPDKTSNSLFCHCPHCSQELKNKRQLKAHILRFHNSESKENVLCDICGKNLTSNRHLLLHRRIHTGEKPHVCKTCGKGFIKKCNLVQHELLHSGEKPHSCSHCGKAFTQKSTLTIHERMHTGVRPYRCEKCKKDFVSKGSLTFHMKACTF